MNLLNMMVELLYKIVEQILYQLNYYICNYPNRIYIYIYNCLDGKRIIQKQQKAGLS